MKKKCTHDQQGYFTSKWQELEAVVITFNVVEKASAFIPLEKITPWIFKLNIE